MKVPTYCPFPLQIYFNGHNWLAQQMKKTGIAFTTLDNAFDYIEKHKRLPMQWTSKRYRQVEHRDGTTSNKMAPLKKYLQLAIAATESAGCQ